MKKIYLSGPITGRPAEKVEEHFRRTRWMLELEAERAGVPIKVITPTDFDHMGLGWETYMKIDLAIIEDPSVDAICLMKGWEKSKGCRQEMMVAKATGKMIVHEPGAVSSITLDGRQA